MKYTSFLVIFIVTLSFFSCSDEPPVLPGLAKSNLVISSFPDNAEVLINSRKQSGTPVNYSDLEPGFYKIDLKYLNYLDTTLYFIVKRNTTDSAFVEMREDPSFWWKTYDVNNSALPSNSISDLEVDKNNSIWIASRTEGLAKFSNNTITKFGAAEGLFSKSLNKLFVDKQNNLWIASKDGLYKYDGFTFKLYNRENSNFPDNNVISVTADNENNIWIGTKTGGLIKFDGVRFYFYNIYNSGLPLNEVSALFVDKNNSLWIGTWGEGLCKFENNKWTYYSIALTNINNEFISSIAEDFEGNIIIGTGTSQAPGGFSILKGASFTNYTIFNSIIPSGIITDIKKGNNGFIWISTSDGLVRYRNGILKLFRTNNSGLPSNVVITVTVDSNDDKWIGSAGLSFYKGSKIIP